MKKLDIPKRSGDSKKNYKGSFVCRTSKKAALKHFSAAS